MGWRLCAHLGDAQASGLGTLSGIRPWTTPSYGSSATCGYTTTRRWPMRRPVARCCAFTCWSPACGRNRTVRCSTTSSCARACATWRNSCATAAHGWNWPWAKSRTSWPGCTRCNPLPAWCRTRKPATVPPMPETGPWPAGAASKAWSGRNGRSMVWYAGCPHARTGTACGRRTCRLPACRRRCLPACSRFLCHGATRGRHPRRWGWGTLTTRLCASAAGAPWACRCCMIFCTSVGLCTGAAFRHR